MKSILIIADDITGAAEIGGIAHQYGLTAAIGVRQIAAGVDANAFVIDTDTRHLSEAAAAQWVTKILERLDLSAFDLIYKKTDSVLRGPIAAELTAIVKCLGVSSSLLVPQNPSRGRTVENNDYRVNGVPLDQTSFAADPEHPAKTSDVRRLVDAGGTYWVECARPADAMPKAGIVIGSAASAEEVRQWSARVDKSVLPAGGADFFTAILQSRGFSERKADVPPLPADNYLLVCGSASDASQQFVDSIASIACAMPDELRTEVRTTEEKFAEWANEIVAKLDEQTRAAMVIRPLPHTTRPRDTGLRPVPAIHEVDGTKDAQRSSATGTGQRPVSREAFITSDAPAIAALAKHLRGVMAEVVARVLESRRPQTLFVEGGATAAALLERMNWRNLSVVAQLSPGVVALRPAESPQQILVLKPGSYPWPTGLG